MPRKCPCGKQSVYNVFGGKPICCKICKTDDMINVVNKRCPCGKQPKFNTPNEKIGVCCVQCKTSDMIDVVNKKCSCGKRPHFNVPEENVGVCCVKCKTDDMVNVTSNRCPCGNIPSFNIPGEKTGVCCAVCKTSEMINVMSKRCSCGKQPLYNFSGEKFGVCCFGCKTIGMIDVVHKICPGYKEPCPVRTMLTIGHKYCMSCDPNDARRKRYKMFEEAFFAYVKDKINVHKREFYIPFDQNDTAKKFARLDGIVFGDSVIVCLEVDENSHQEYECDEHRMHLVTAELLQKYPVHVISWVRVNPTIDAKSQWSKTSKSIRDKRFEEVVSTVNDILKTRDTRVVYIGFD